MNNPFTLVFGKSPLLTVERPTQTDEILDALKSENIYQQAFIITGIRGSGKTVMMTEIAEKIKDEKEWIVVELNPEKDLEQGLAAKLYNNTKGGEIIRNAKINLSFFGIGVEISGSQQITDIEVALERILSSIKKQGKRVLITIDEVTNNEYMRIFAHEFQMLIRQNAPVFLLMTGLFENISDLQNEKTLTFLYRAPKIQLSSLNAGAITEKYYKVFEAMGLDKEDCSKMAGMTKGYPFAFQTLGYLTWEKNGDYNSTIDEYRLRLEEYVYEKIWSELSPNDRKVACGIAKAEDGKVKTILECLNMDSNHFNPYRKRLITKGIIVSDGWGNLKFFLPMFAEYVLSKEINDI